MAHRLTSNQAVKWAATAEYLKKLKPHKQFQNIPKRTPKSKLKAKAKSSKHLFIPVVSLAASCLAVYPAIRFVINSSRVVHDNCEDGADESSVPTKVTDAQQKPTHPKQDKSRIAYTGAVYGSAMIALMSGVLLRSFTAF